MTGATRRILLIGWALILGLGPDWLRGGARETVAAPDGGLEVTIELEDGNLFYSVRRGQRVIIRKSGLSLEEAGGYRIAGARTHSVDRTWEPVWGQFSEVRDRYRELRLDLHSGSLQPSLLCRVYDDGVGLRFVLPPQPAHQGRSLDYKIDFLLDADYPMYHPRGESEPAGPLPVSAFDPDDRGPAIPALAALGKDLPSALIPAVLDLGAGLYVAILESDLYTAVTAARTEAMELLRAQDQPGLSSSNTARLSGESYESPWRVILIGSRVGELALNQVPLNLAAPCRVSETAWVKAGKSMWDWKVRGYQAPDFRYGVDTASYKRLIDFGSEHNIAYLLIDWLWYRVREGVFTVNAEIDIREVTRYGREKGVQVLLYWDEHRGGALPMEEVFGLYAGDLGAAGVKYGFRGNDAGFTAEAIRRAAGQKLVIDFHDKVCPMVGVERTYPNALTREYGHAQMDAGRVSSPRAFLKTAMINMIAGPLDLNYGFYALHTDPKTSSRIGWKQDLASTVAAENARVLICFSGLSVLPDAPEEYLKKADLFEFLARLPQGGWDESRLLASRLARHLSVARRKGEEWFVGTVVDEAGGSLSISLDFLEPGRTYDVTYYEDGDDTHYQTNRESYRVRRGKVRRGDAVQAQMAPGGGHSMWIRPQAVGVGPGKVYLNQRDRPKKGSKKGLRGDFRP